MNKMMTGAADGAGSTMRNTMQQSSVMTDMPSVVNANQAEVAVHGGAWAAAVALDQGCAPSTSQVISFHLGTRTATSMLQPGCRLPQHLGVHTTEP